MKKLALLFAVLALGVALGAFPAGSQQPSAEPDGEIHIETVEVEVINIDVYVTDKNGEPVRGLTKDDFVLSVDSRGVPVSNFYAVTSEEEAGAPEPESGRDLQVEEDQPVGVPDWVPPASPPTPPDQQLHIVVYIDNFNLTPFNRNRVMRELRQFLYEELGPDDQVMLASFDRSLHLRYPFTSDPREINEALLELEEVSAQRIHRNRERQDLIAMINDRDFEHKQDSEAGYYEGVALNQLRTYAESERNDIHFTLDSLARVVENLAGSPGRKAVVYVSDGIPMIAGEDLFYLISQRYESSISLVEMTEFDFSRRLQELAAKANANRVTFYTIDARGLTVTTQGTVDQATAGEPGQQAFIDSVWTTNMQAPLQLLADETGGRAIINANRIGPDLLRMGTDFENYYSLGYAPIAPGGGRYHRIEVKLRKGLKGMNVRHRSGYRDKTIEQRMIDGTLSALNLNLQANSLGARVVVGQPKRRSDGNFDTPVFVEVPFDKLTLIERDGNFLGELRVWFAAKDEKDHSTEAQQIPVDIRIPADRIGETEGQNYTYAIEMTMESGYHDLAVGVRDELGGDYAFLRQGIEIRADT
ncbi:MAG: VWA domain-containing protein [Thermoanaerobaculia bacterium]